MASVYKHNALWDQLSTEVQLILQVRESERTSFSKEYSAPTITLADVKQKSQHVQFTWCNSIENFMRFHYYVRAAGYSGEPLLTVYQ